MAQDEPSPTTADRLRHRLDRHATVAVALLVVVALLAGYVAVGTHTAPETTTERQVVGSWSANASFAHEATVQRESPAFPAGRTLADRPLYFTTATPELDGTYTFEYDGDAENVDVETDLSLVVRSVERTDGSPTVYWNVTEPLTSAETTDLGPNEAHTVSFTVNVSERQALANTVEEQLGASPGGREVVVVADTTATADLAGEEQDVGRTDLLIAQPAGVVYEVGSEIAGAQGDTVREAVEVPVERNPLPAYGAPLVTLLALVGAVGIAYLDRGDRLAVAPGTRAAIERIDDHGRFEEWISAGRAPIDADDRVVEMETLEDLVDVAIDASERVVHDAGAGWYVVIDGDVVYRYEAGASDGDGANGATTGPGSTAFRDGDQSEGEEPAEEQGGEGPDASDGN